jgi:iron-sulfur cluster assembly protein
MQGSFGAGALRRTAEAGVALPVAVGLIARRPMSDTATVSALAPASLPEGVRAGNETLVCLTAAAGNKVTALMARERQGDFLRIAITGGGCNGLSYKMKFVPEPKRGDIMVRTGGVPVLVDSKSALYLKGTHVDYSSAMVAGGFKFSNPNAKASCSCGESFSV